MAERHQVRPQRRFGAGGIADHEQWSRARRRFSARVWGIERPPTLKEWADIGREERIRLARRATVVAGTAIFSSSGLVGVETFLLVQLAYNGGQLTRETTVGAPNFPAMVIAIVFGLILNVLFALLAIRPQLEWFVSGAPADHARRRSVQRIPMTQAAVTVGAWLAAVVGYALLSIISVASFTLPVVLGVAVAFAMAGLTIGCMSYLFAERFARPLSIIALQDNPATHVMHGVRGRMIAVWAVSTAVPMAGLLILNIGRWSGLLPPVAGAIDWAAVVLAMVGLATGARVIALVGQAVIDPLTELRHAVQKVQQGDLTTHVDVYDSSELGVLQNGFNEMVTGLDERERMRELFARHVGDTVAELALSHGVGMHGTNTEVGVLFVDIIGSTSIAAQQDPQDTVELLNGFFTVVADVVDSHGGFVNKFEGDAALAVFGAPVAIDQPAGAALAAARELAARLEELPVRWGIGVSFGMSFAGNVGAEQRYEYTVIGDPVNECARLSEMAKTAKVPVLASGSAIAECGDESQSWQSVGSRVLRGRNTPTDVYVPVELAGRPDSRTTVGDMVAGLLRPARAGVAGLIRPPFPVSGTDGRPVDG
ncbi:adenylate/guanylate cyclase domain-containing protein [Gordonia sp. NPDC003424]